MGKVMTADMAASHIHDGATITVSAASGLGCPDAVLRAIGAHFDRSGHPRELTTIHPLAAGDMYGIAGIGALAKPGLLKRVLAGSYPSGPSSAPEPDIWRMIRENTIAAYNFPAGTLFDLHREAAQTGLGRLTEVGLNTFADPRQQGCKMNEAATDDVVSVVEFQGRELLYYHPIAPEIAIVRGTTADGDGNISMEHEGAYLGAHEQALAARANGGIVIAQVARLTETASRSPREIHIPGHLVDFIVVAPDQMQTTMTDYDPAISGQVRRPSADIPPLEWTIEKVIARRVACELRAGEVVNVGFGISADVPRILHETGASGDIAWVTEQGATGGLPLTGFQFGCAMNPDAIMPWNFQFAMLQAGVAHRALLSFLEADADGNINVTRLAARPHVTAGAGGFLDITTRTANLVFAGRFDAGGTAIEIVDGALHITQPGKIVKLVDRVGHVSFSGQMGLRRGQRVTLITERCVMHFGATGWVLSEVAPGIDIGRDIVDRVPFAIDTSTTRLMDAALFRPDPYGVDLHRPVDAGTQARFTRRPS